MRRPSQRSIDLYNQLVAQQNKVRKQLRKLHKKAEETLGAGRLPALIIPKSARKVRMFDFYGLSPAQLRAKLEAFWKSYREKRSLFGKGLRSYIARTVKDGYMELWRDQILFMAGEEPSGEFGKFSKEQIENSYMGEYMEVYNMMISMAPETYLALLYSGKIIQFKYIYQDMISGLGGRENSWLQQQKELLSLYRSHSSVMQLWDAMSNIMPKEIQNEFFSKEEMKNADKIPARNRKDYEDVITEGKAKSYTGKHKGETVEKAIELQQRRTKR